MCEDTQRFLLKWHRHATTIFDQLPLLLEAGLFTDVTISVEGCSLKAHRLILASCSPYFLQLFQDISMPEHPVIILQNMDVHDVKAILTFMYKGECCIFKDRIPSLLSAAKTLKIQGLSDIELNDYADNSQEEKEESMANNNSNLKKSRTKTSISKMPKMEKIVTNKQLNAKIINDKEMNPPMKRTHRDTPETYKCFVCGKHLSNQYNLRVHMETHDEAYHACSSCPHISRSRDALRKHMSYRHPDKYFARKQKKNL